MNLNPNNLGFLKVHFSGGGNLTPAPFIIQEKLIQIQYNFLKLLNNLFIAKAKFFLTLSVKYWRH